MSYQPKPLDNSHIELGPELENLVETLARNNHELWARARMANGWRFGPGRNDSTRETPVLVPYEDLPEQEKEYDRLIAAESLKSIIRFGGKVHPPSTSATDAVPPGRTLTVAGPGEWRPKRLPPPAYEDYRAWARNASGKGQALLAFDIANEALALWPTDSELLQTKALALARMGSAEQAREILAALQGTALQGTALQGTGDDEETSGILARTYKDVWLRTGDEGDLRTAAEKYRAAWGQHPQNYWTGINAATLAWVLKDEAGAAELAKQIASACSRQLADASEDQKYWLIATIAEASLIVAACSGPLGNEEVWNQTARLYSEVRALGGNNFGHLFSTWRNARIILQRLPRAQSERIETAFGRPQVAVFAGHRLDKAGRLPPRFPPESAKQVKAAIRGCLVRRNVRIGFSTAASGADILFLEALQELGGQTCIVLPCELEQFIEESVRDAGEEWVRRFHRVAEKAEEIVFASDQRLIPGGSVYRYASDVLDGLAAMRASEHGSGIVHIAVWNGLSWDGPGGTADTVARWKARGFPVEVIDPIKIDPIEKVNTAASIVSAPPVAGENSELPTPGGDTVAEIRAMIFADVKHFSQLSESQIPGFLRDFMGPVSEVAAGFHPQPLFGNTWGDGLFFVFATVKDAGRFAVQLRDAVASIDREKAGLPADMYLRIALHAGPVFRFRDRILGKENYMGYHVNRTARIEPVTPQGRIYATELFAALATLEAPSEFRFDYVGKVPLAKSFGDFSMYDVSRASRQ